MFSSNFYTIQFHLNRPDPWQLYVWFVFFQIKCDRFFIYLRALFLKYCKVRGDEKISRGQIILIK